MNWHLTKTSAGLQQPWIVSDDHGRVFTTVRWDGARYTYVDSSGADLGNHFNNARAAVEKAWEAGKKPEVVHGEPQESLF